MTHQFSKQSIRAFLFGCDKPVQTRMASSPRLTTETKWSPVQRCIRSATLTSTAPGKEGTSMNSPERLRTWRSTKLFSYGTKANVPMGNGGVKHQQCYLQTPRAAKQQGDAAVVRMLPTSQLTLLHLVVVHWRVVQRPQCCAVPFSCRRHNNTG